MIILSVILAISCEDFLSFPDHDTRLHYPVIEAVLTDSVEVQKVRVTWSVDVEDTLSGWIIDNSIVKIVSSAGDTVNFEYADNGWYHSPVFAAHSGVNYTLEVTIGTDTYRSSGSIQELRDFDSIYYKYSRNPDASDSSYYVYFDYSKPDPKNTCYYMIDVDSNNVRLTQGSGLIIYEDRYIDYLKGVLIPVAFNENDTAVITAHSLSRDMYEYYYKLGYQVFSMDLTSISYQTNLPQMFAPKALGYFQVSAVRSRRIIIK